MQSISAALAPKCAFSVAQSREVSTGEGRTSTFDCTGPVSRMFARLPNRVERLITRVSRKESIGGLVTCEKFWRKNWLISRGLSEMTASGVSSPIDPIASLASSTQGARISSMSSIVMPAATWRRISSGRSKRASAASSGTGRSASFWKSLTYSPNGCSAARRSLSSESVNSLPASRSTAIICPGPIRPLAMIVLSGTTTMPVSDPTISRLSAVSVVRSGRSALRSTPATTQRPSVIASAAGPSHGSITEA